MTMEAWLHTYAPTRAIHREMRRISAACDAAVKSACPPRGHLVVRCAHQADLSYTFACLVVWRSAARTSEASRAAASAA